VTVANANASATVSVSAERATPAFLDLKAQFAAIRDEVYAAVSRVLESQHFIMGPEVASLEKEIQPFVGSGHIFGCASGSDALLLALMALGVGPGDEVIAPPFTFVATAGAIARLHARPVFADIDPRTYNLDPNQFEKLISARTKAIIPVHLFGLAADMDPIMEIANRRGVAVIEDAAQALGAKYHGKTVGSIGTLGCFSFFPSKNLGGAGDGGLVTTNDPKLADRLKVLRTHGSRSKYEYELIGMNSRLDAMQAAILRVKLPYVDQWTLGRRRNAERYRSLFAGADLDGAVQLPAEASNCFHVYNQFTIRTQRRDALKKFLADRGVPTEIYYPHPLHLQPAFAYLGHKAGDLRNSEAASAEVLSLPIYAELSDEQLQSVVTAIAEFYSCAQ
jgi:dTDP-4-amino-4,6-dideoxygalactose transaminase